MDEVSEKRIFVGGLFEGVTDADLRERFQRFGTVTSVEVKNKRNQQGHIDKTFAYLDLNISAGNYKKCLTTYNNTKWKGGIVNIQPAKDNFLTRLKEERKVLQQEQQQNIPKPTKTNGHPYHPRVEKRLDNFKAAGVKDYHVEKAVPGTPIDGERNWVVGKYGRVVPIVYIRRRDKKKVMKVDPSKYVHHLKVMKDPDSKTDSDLEERNNSVTELTWNVPEITTVDYKKRKGEFPSGQYSSPKKIAKKLNSGTVGIESNPDEIEMYAQNYVQDQRTSPTPNHKKEQNDVPHTNFVDEVNTTESASDDLQVVGVEDIKSAVTSYSSYLMNLNRRTRMQEDTLHSDDKRRSVISSKDYDSGEESCDSADTDEICSAKKGPTRKEVTRDKSQLNRLGDQIHHGNEESDSDDTGEIIAMSKSSRLNSQDHSKTISSQATVSGVKTNPAVSFNSKDFFDDNSTDDSEDGSTNDLEIDDSPKTQDHTHIQVDVQKNLVADEASSDEDESSHENQEDVFKPGPVAESGHMPRITQANLASLMGETSSDDSDGSSNESADEEDGDIRNKERGSDGGSDDYSDSDSNSSSDVEDNETSSRPSSLAKVSQEIVEQNCQINTKMLLEKTESSQRSTQPERMREVNSSQNEKQMEKKSESKPHKLKDDATNSSKSHVPSLEKKVKKTGATKKTLSNEARLESLKQKQSEMSKQKALIHGALTSLDSKSTTSPGKHVHFDSDDSESEDGIAEQTEALQEKTDLSKKKGLQLFDSDDEELVGGDEEDRLQLEKFEQPQFEGKTGAKLMKLQSRFGGDDRFKLDTRFLEKDKDSDSDDTQGKGEDVEDEDEDLKEERKKSLAILEKIVGTKAMSKNKAHSDPRNTFKDLSAIHYDPSKEEHSKFEQKTPESPSHDKNGDDITRSMQREELPMPEVSEDKFYEVSHSLKDAFGSTGIGSSGGEDKGDKTPFTFFAQEEEEEDDEPAVTKAADASTTPLSSLDLMWQPKKFAFDSSDSEQEETIPKKRMADVTKKDREAEKPVPKKFFFQEGDVRLKEGPLWFFNVPNAAYREEKMKEKEEELKAGFRKRHRRAVRTWNRKKMEKRRKPNR